MMTHEAKIFGIIKSNPGQAPGHLRTWKPSTEEKGIALLKWFDPRQDSNPGPLDQKSNALTTEPKISAFVADIQIRMVIRYNTFSVAAWPGLYQTWSETQNAGLLMTRLIHQSYSYWKNKVYTASKFKDHLYFCCNIFFKRLWRFFNEHEPALWFKWRFEKQKKTHESQTMIRESQNNDTKSYVFATYQNF